MEKKIKLAAPANKKFEKLVSNYQAIKEESNIELYLVDEAQCRNLLFTNRVDAALVTPLSYGLTAGKEDYRIIPGRLLAGFGYTGLASVFFKQGVERLKNFCAQSADEYISIIAKILMEERYNLNIEVVPKTEKDNCDGEICWEKSGIKDSALDLAEMFTDSYGIPLILGIWACRAEEHPPEIQNIVFNLSDKSLNLETPTHTNGDEIHSDSRPGSLIYHWAGDIEKVLADTLDLLYYKQYIPEISDIKILGDEKATL